MTNPESHAANLFDGIAAALDTERFDGILARAGVRIERILSPPQAEPGGWYDQDWDEWVLLVAGSAGLELAACGERRLAPGDHLLIPARVRHRVLWTDPYQPTLWLAVHLGEKAA